MAFEDFFPEVLKRALESLQSVPTYGERSAERFLYNLLKLEPQKREEILKVLMDASYNLTECSECGLMSDINPCRICSSPIRNRKLLCVVEESKDVYAIERTEKYSGLYHVLGGRIAPLEGISPEDLRIDSLMKRIEMLTPKEIILATNPNVEGEATANYVASLIKKSFPKARITRLAYGLPFGAFLEFMDEITIESSIENRKEV